MAKSKTEKAIDAIKKASTMEELVAAVVGLEPKDRNAKPVAWAVHQATERVVGQPGQSR
jgi:hypothetical protein